MANQYLLTTKDNPYDPFDQFTEWYCFDKEKGYDSCERLDRIARIDDSMSDVEANIEIERAIDEIISNDILDIYVKVSKPLKDVDEGDLED